MSNQQQQQTHRALERLHQLTGDWAVADANASTVLASLANLLAQRTRSASFILRATSSSTPSTPSTSSSNRLHIETALIKNPVVRPAFLTEFPDALPRLIRKQTNAVNQTLNTLTELIDVLRAIVASVQTLSKDTTAKSLASLASFRIPMHPVEIPTFVAADWIESMCACYERELFFKEDLIASLDVSDTHGVQSVAVVQREWSIAQWLDLQLEVAIRDRLMLAKRFALG